jgi:hypothetical protein
LIEDADVQMVEAAKGKLTWRQYVLETAKAITQKRIKGWPPKIDKKKRKPDT